MKQLGISIYPEKSDFATDSLYISKAASLGFTRLFISLLELTGDQNDILREFKKTITFAREAGFQVILDVSPAVFSKLGISYDDLGFFAELGADGIRLDLGFSGVEEAAMTHNPYNLLIEINMSHGTEYLENIMSRRPRTGYLIGSHNFYPHAFTGLELSFFEKCCQKFRNQNIPTAAFINAPSATFGPWPMAEGICTLEDHRRLSIEAQAAHLLFSDWIDCVIIGNAYASDKELAAVAKIAKMSSIPIRATLKEGITEMEREILLGNQHIYRGEQSAYVLRTKSDGRKKYAHATIAPHFNEEITPGAILLDNDLYLQYKGELQIAKKARPKDEKVNVIGQIFPDDQLLLDTLVPWSTFHFEEA